MNEVKFYTWMPVLSSRVKQFETPDMIASWYGIVCAKKLSRLQ